MATVSVGSNKSYSEGWDAIFKKGKTSKKQTSPAKASAKTKKPTPARKKGGSQKSSRKSTRKN